VITKLRQGNENLIRTKENKGVCSILDSRMNLYDERRDLILNSLPIKKVITKQN